MIAEPKSSADDDARRDGPYRTAGAQTYAIVLLMLVYVFGMLDRTIVSVLLQPIKAEFSLTDTQLGFMSGLMFAIAYTLTAFPFGYAVDRLPRVRLLAVILVVWSALTFVSGLTASFLFLCLARIGVGLAEGGQYPAVLSIAGDVVPARRRATALSVIHMGIPLGALLSFLISIWVAETHGWRAALLAAGGPGMVLALVIVLTLREPPREQAITPAQAPYSVRRFIDMLRTQPTILLMLVATGFISMNNSAVSVWLPALLMRKFDMSLAEVSTGLVFSAGLCGIIGALAAGPLCDAFARGSTPRILRFTAVLFLLPGPLTLLSAQVSSFTLAMVFNGLLSGAVPACLACLYTSLFGLASASARGLMIATVSVITNLIGYGLGPQIVGLLSDILPATSPSGSLQAAMTCMAVAAFCGALLMLVACVVQARHAQGGAGDGVTGAAR